MHKLLTAACAAILSSSATAWADVQYCNGTDEPIVTAIMFYPQVGYDENKNYMRTVRGWWRLEPKECRTVLSGPVTGSGYYVAAHSVDRKRIWGGSKGVAHECGGLSDQAYNKCLSASLKVTGFEQMMCVDYDASFTYVACRVGTAAQDYALQCPANHPAYTASYTKSGCNGRYRYASFGLAARNDHNPEVARKLREGGFYVLNGSEQSSNLESSTLTHRLLFSPR